MSELLSLLFYGSFALVGVIVVSFLLWFRLRNQPRWDSGLFVAASAAMAVLAAGMFLLGGAGLILAIPVVPSLGIYLWFSALRRSRRQHAAILRWAAREGYVVTSLEQTTVMTSMQRLASEYRIVARRRSDGRIRSGRVLTDRSISNRGFEVVWDAEVGTAG